MKWLLDQGLARGTVPRLIALGHDARHVGDHGQQRATDTEIIEMAKAEGRAIATLDADFHSLIAVAGTTQPSVLRIRIEGLDAQGTALLIDAVSRTFGPELLAGAFVTTDESTTRVRRLPIA